MLFDDLFVNLYYVLYVYLWFVEMLCVCYLVVLIDEF